MIENSQPCAAYKDGKLYKAYTSQKECAKDLRVRQSKIVNQAIARKGKVRTPLGTFAIRNYTQ